jgi:signal recognition particle subunit SRP68
LSYNLIVVSYTHLNFLRSLELSLFEAERAWTHSHELAADPNYPDKGTLRHRATGRFRRAFSHSSTLLSQARTLYSQRMSAGQLLEIAAYHLTLKGRFYLRRDEFAPALGHLAAAWAILTELAKDASTSRDQALYTYFSDEIAPQIRFAAHSLGHKAAYHIDAVVREVSTSEVTDALLPEYDDLVRRLREERAKGAASSGSSGRAMLREPVWEGKPVPIRNPELVDAFIEVQNAEDAMADGINVSKHPKNARTRPPPPAGAKDTQASGASNTTRGRVSAFDGILLALADAQQVAQRQAEFKVIFFLALPTQISPNSFTAIWKYGRSRQHSRWRARCTFCGRLYHIPPSFATHRTRSTFS